MQFICLAANKQLGRMQLQLGWCTPWHVSRHCQPALKISPSVQPLYVQLRSPVMLACKASCPVVMGGAQVGHGG